MAGDIADLSAERGKRWRMKLLRIGGLKGRPRKIVANAMIALREAPEWRGALRYDENALLPQLERQPPNPWPIADKWVPRPWNDQDDGLFSEWLARENIDISMGMVSEAAQLVARENSFHPIREYLAGLKWDGVPRVGKWLTTYVGAEETIYHSAGGQRFLISAVARVLQPGCQADCMPVLEGLHTGEGKSTFLRELTSPWFSDQARDLGSRDTAMSIAGKWLIEVAELEAFKGASAEQLKAFISRRVDRFRPPYGRRVIDNPRQCVFVGTTNKDQYLIDETGNRRYWPIRCGSKLDIEAIRRDRNMLWAEAKKLYESGTPWWLETSELRFLASSEQDNRFDEDPIQAKIEVFVAEKKYVSITEIANEILGIEDTAITRPDQLRIGKILRHLGWTRIQLLDVDGIQRRYFKRLSI